MRSSSTLSLLLAAAGVSAQSIVTTSVVPTSTITPTGPSTGVSDTGVDLPSWKTVD